MLLGFFLGGGRALYRVARGKPVSSVYEVEFIRLHLERLKPAGDEESPDASEGLTSAFACGKTAVNPRETPKKRGNIWSLKGECPAKIRPGITGNIDRCKLLKYKDI